MTDATNAKFIYVVRKGWHPDQGQSLDYLMFNEPYCKTFEFKQEALDYYNSIYMEDYDSGLFPTIFRLTVSNPVEVTFSIEETVVTS
tara:strand:+ start:118 stop:378 length:261 start_codon:yes stop_codon:yes gene_type:complete